MKFKDSFELRDICGEKILISSGVESINFNHLINLNETAAEIYTQFSGKDFEPAEVVDFLEKSYPDVSKTELENDVQALLAELLKMSVIA